MGQDLLNIRNAKLGTIGVYVAAEDTAYNASSGWTDLGVMDPGTFVPEFPREMFKLETGFPRSVKMMAVVGTSGMVDFALTEYTPYAAEIAAGSGAGNRTYAATPAPNTVASSPTVNGCTMTSAAAFAVGMLVEVTTPNGLELTYLDTKATNVVTWKPALSVAPIAAAAIKAVKNIRQALGSAVIPRMAFKAVFTDQNGEVVTLHIPACSVPDGWKPNFGDGTSNVKLPLKFEAYGKDATWNGVSQQIVAYVHHDYPNVS
jgi:hypothetical protein